MSRRRVNVSLTIHFINLLMKPCRQAWRQNPSRFPAAVSIPRIGGAPARKATACSTTFSITSRTSASGRCGSRSRTARAHAFATPCRPGRAISPPCMTSSCATFSLTPPAIRIPASWAGCMAAATSPGMLAEMLAAGLNANLGGRDHMPIEVERQIAHWLRQLFEFPRHRQRAVRHRHVDGQSASAC